MDQQTLAGAALVLLAGLLQGLFALPMKFARRWNHENIWMIFACSGLIVFPWLLTFATVPHVGALLGATSSRELLGMVGFGLVWGAGATLTGVGLNLLGIGLGLSIILGLSASIGSLVPLIILSPQKLGTPQGHLFLVGTIVMLAGIALCARAGALRDAKGQVATPSEGIPRKSTFLAGLIVCIGSGIFSSALNFSYAFGAGLIANAQRFGAPPVWASNIVAALATSGGFVANCVYCVVMFRRNHSASRFAAPGTGMNWVYGSAMGALWFGGLALYGLGISQMGSFGTVTGWSLLMGMIILASNSAGYLTGEWRGAGKRVGVTLAAGMAIILGALWILAIAQKA